MDDRPKKRALLSQDNSNNNVSISSRIAEQVEEEDRLSNLPYDLLISILSLLPIDLAAVTSVLSRRWRHLWTHVTHISLPTLRPSRAFLTTESFVATVDHILSQLNSPKIHSFKLSSNMDMFKLARWIRQVCLRDPEILLVFAYFSHRKIYKLPICIFQTRSLLQLELDSLSGFDDVPDDDGLFSINLPNLKKLKLCLYDSDRWLMRNLCKSCPLLEDLSLRMLRLQEDHFVDISAPNLKLLFMQIGESNFECSKNHKVVIDAPMLEQCHIKGYLVDFEFISKPTRLRQVTLTILDEVLENGNDYISNLLQLFQGICCVEHLILENWKEGLLCLLDDIALPIFRHLTHLVIIRCDVRHCLNPWPLPCLPACLLLGNLKQLEIRDVTGIKFPINVLEDILSKATLLEQFHIITSIADFVCRIHSKYMRKIQKESEFCKRLFMIPKCSSSCEVGFFGNVINASDKDFKDGVLAYQVIPLCWL